MQCTDSHTLALGSFKTMKTYKTTILEIASFSSWFFMPLVILTVFCATQPKGEKYTPNNSDLDAQNEMHRLAHVNAWEI